MAITDEMKFEELRDSMTALLRANETGLFVTIDAQLMSRSAEELKDAARTVQVFFQEMDSDPSKATKNQFDADDTYVFELSASAAATADLAGLKKDSGKTPEEKALILAQSKRGSFNADRSLDELWRIVVQIIMDSVNEDLGLPKYTVSDRKLRNFRKNQINDHGNLVTISGTGRLTATLTETVTGATPTTPTDNLVDTTNKFTESSGDPADETGDGPSKTGVQTKPTP